MSNQFGPQTSWPCQFTCDVSTESATATGIAAMTATQVIWALSGRRFTTMADVTLRPCPNWKRDTPFPDSWMSWPGTQAPPLGATSSGGYEPGWWFGAGCGSCLDGCTCPTPLTEVKLPAPVYSITTVRVDGMPLVTGAYRLDDNCKLMRVDGGSWPVSNNLTLDDSQVGTWSVTAKYGEGLPDGANLAVGELACEILKAMNGEDCRLPRTVTNIVRQGVSVSIPSVSDMFANGVTGLYLVDIFIKTWNPKALRARARSYSVDSLGPRRVGTSS